MSDPLPHPRHWVVQATWGFAWGRDALDGKGPQRWPQKRLDRRLQGVAKAVGGGYCRLQKRAPAVRETVAGYRLGALEGGWGGVPPLPMRPWPGDSGDEATDDEPEAVRNLSIIATESPEQQTWQSVAEDR